jgi:hypothetical protein
MWSTANDREMLDARERARYSILKAVYGVSRCNKNTVIEEEMIQNLTGLSAEDVSRAFEYLVDEGLLHQLGSSSIGIAHPGIVEYEQSIKEPERPTDHFRPLVIQSLNQTFNGPIGTVQAGERSSANVVQNIGVQVSEMEQLLQAVQDAATDLGPGAQQGFQEQLDDLRNEIRSLKPKSSRVKAFLAVMWQAASTVGAVAPKVLELAEKLGYPLLPPK